MWLENATVDSMDDWKVASTAALSAGWKGGIEAGRSDSEMVA